jgi:hypothetical protein
MVHVAISAGAIVCTLVVLVVLGTRTNESADVAPAYAPPPPATSPSAPPPPALPATTPSSSARPTPDSSARRDVDAGVAPPVGASAPPVTPTPPDAGGSDRPDEEPR